MTAVKLKSHDLRLTKENIQMANIKKKKKQEMESVPENCINAPSSLTIIAVNVQLPPLYLCCK